ncbi:hypothetical protein [Caloranaerobacter ferrireducens]|uniref:hypothetical protein n=1 Tax=Caloranaerobacter ferrireducens TaxID=1323370 RepID=UPI00159F1486|nr:hypothetical protein [Caloranaerobacter ferrireducens]
MTKESVFGVIVGIDCGEYFYNDVKIWSDECDLWLHKMSCELICYEDSIDKTVYY